MIVKIDLRETEVLNKINNLIATVPIFNKIIVKTEMLPLGDIIISDDIEDKLIIERKTVSDLLASIKDGRYDEQSYRLSGLKHHNHNIIYLIEGDINRLNSFKHNNKNDNLTFYSSIFSLNYYKGYSVLRSFSLEETAIMICNMAYKLEKEKTNKKSFYNNLIEIKSENNLECEKTENNILEEVEQSEKNYVNVVKKVKKENITPENIGEIMLCQIPGISSVTALAIMEKYMSLSNLIKEIELNNDCLKNLTSVNSKGQLRKINKTSLTNIVKFLLKK
jgi:ERCC4-type nuclease